MDEKWLGLIPKLCYIVTKTFGDFVRDIAIFGNLLEIVTGQNLTISCKRQQF